MLIMPLGWQSKGLILTTQVKETSTSRFSLESIYLCVCVCVCVHMHIHTVDIDIDQYKIILETGTPKIILGH